MPHTCLQAPGRTWTVAAHCWVGLLWMIFLSGQGGFRGLMGTHPSASVPIGNPCGKA